MVDEYAQHSWYYILECFCFCLNSPPLHTEYVHWHLLYCRGLFCSQPFFCKQRYLTGLHFSSSGQIKTLRNVFILYLVHFKYTQLRLFITHSFREEIAHLECFFDCFLLLSLSLLFIPYSIKCYLIRNKYKDLKKMKYVRVILDTNYWTYPEALKLKRRECLIAKYWQTL